MILASFKHGFAQMRANKRMVLVYYLANLLFGLILMLPLRAVLSNYIGASEMGAKLGGPMDMDFLFEFLTNNEALVPTQMGMLMVVPALYWLFGLFLSGGAFAVFASQDRYTANQFWGGAATHFGKFLRLALYALPVLGVLYCVQYLETGVQRVVWGEDAYQNITYWGAWTRLGIATLSMICFGAIFDYARIHVVLNEERKMRLSMWRAVKFTFGNFLPAFGLAFLMFLCGALLLAVYNPVANSFSAANGLIIFMLFLVQQFYMLARLALKLSLYAGEVHLYQQCAVAEAPQTATPAHDLDVEGLAPAME